MYDKPFQLDIVAPDRVVFKGSAMSVTAPGLLGSFQVLYNHAPLLAQLVSGEVKVKALSGEDSYFAIGGGFAEVRDNHVVILADSAENPEEIDVERAQDAKDNAQDEIRARGPGDRGEEAQAALARAMTRLKIARKHQK
ncbi:MAG: F0F1 ATP synthase subunit epsilon [Bacteroidota bacterium]